MGDYDTNIMETVSRLIYEYKVKHHIEPTCIFISRDIISVLMAQGHVKLHNAEKNYCTVAGLRLYDVVQDGTIVVTD